MPRGFPCRNLEQAWSPLQVPRSGHLQRRTGWDPVSASPTAFSGGLSLSQDLALPRPHPQDPRWLSAPPPSLGLELAELRSPGTRGGSSESIRPSGSSNPKGLAPLSLAACPQASGTPQGPQVWALPLRVPHLVGGAALLSPLDWGLPGRVSGPSGPPSPPQDPERPPAPGPGGFPPELGEPGSLTWGY